MDSSPLSGCGNPVVFSGQGQPGEEGACASHRGRDVAGRGVIDVQQFARKLVRSGFSSIMRKSDYCPKDLLSGQPVNSEANSHLDNMRKLTAVLGQFGYQHPFYMKDKMADYASDIDKKFAPLVTTNIDNGKKCNILITLLLAYQFSFSLRLDDTLLQAVSNMDPGFFSQHLRCVELYLQMSNQPISTLQAEQVQELYDLVQETEFFPAAWFLVKLALNDENRYLFSVFFLPSLLAPFLRRADELEMLVNVFFPTLKDAMIYFNQLEKLKSWKPTYQVSAVDVFLAHVASTLSGEPVTNNQWLQQQSSVSESVQMKLFAEWTGIITSRRPGGMEHVRNVNTRCPYEVVNEIVTQTGKKFISKRQFKAKRAELFKQHDKGVVRRNLYMQLLQEEQVQQSPFIVAIIRLTQGLMYQRSAVVERRPMTSLMHLVNTAETGIFPLLHKNAGDIYFGYGLFEKARKQYQQLYSHPGLPEPLRKRLESLIEMCDLNIPTPPQTSDQVPAQPVPEKTGKVRHRQRKKTTSAAEPVASATVAEDQHKVSLSDDELPPETPIPSVDGGAADQQDDQTYPEDSEADLAAAGFTTVSYSRARKNAEFRSKSGHFSDHNHQVRLFIREVNCFRDEANLAGEKECIERWLQDERVYGRICEDAAWFYLRQCILPIQIEPEVLDCDLRAMKKDQFVSKERMLNFALGWVARAMTCYLKSPLEPRIRSGQLQGILVSFHKDDPDNKFDFEACKRLRSGCSGFGHVFSEWSALVRNSKLKVLHMQKGHEFFALKRIADPLYYLQEPEEGFFCGRKVDTTSDSSS